MTTIQPSSFAADWFAEWITEPPSFGPATEGLNALIVDSPDKAWASIQTLISSADNAEKLNLIGAGPLEDLIAEHGPLLIDRISAQAEGDPFLVQCLAFVWGRTRIEPSVYAQIRHIVGPEKSYPPPEHGGAT